MSADNFLITIPAKNGAIALYDVSMSDSELCLDDRPTHEVCAYIAQHYARNLVGTYPDTTTMDVAAARYMREQVVEYGLIDYCARINSQASPKSVRGPGG